LAPDADGATKRWFPDFRDAILEAARDTSDIVVFDIQIIKIHEHPIDTTEHAVRTYGRMLFREIERECV